MLTRWGGIAMLMLVGVLLTTHTPVPYGTSSTVQYTSSSSMPITQAGGSEYTGMLQSPTAHQQLFACGIGDVACYSIECVLGMSFFSVEKLDDVLRS
ncbi:hypothetical protein [Ktedonobacter racemifer]|nr:hypothetical protein [Ktedonobacter racemifer]